jgi:ribose 5-phosphate isomerase A
MDNQTRLKQTAARQALSLVEDGMTLGLGTGSTTWFFVQFLGEALQQGQLKNIRCVPTSENTARHARDLGIPLVPLDDVQWLDLAVDGADEVAPDLSMIKGLGKALLREKLVEIHARQLWIIVDESKLVRRLGEHVPLPVEIVPFAHGATLRWLNSLPDCRAELWLKDDGTPWVTDNEHYLVLCRFDNGITDPEKLGRNLNNWPGVMEHGLFLGMATGVIVASEQGVRVLGQNDQF